MQLRHSSTLMQPSEGSTPWKARVTAICFAPDNSRLAVVTTDRIVSIYDSNGERVDKFSTKPNDKGPKNYLVRAMNFCPDPTQPKLAIAQSDNIVFVYKWTGSPESIWEGKKSICNKFAGSSPVTSLVWPTNHPFEVVYGLAEGKVKIGQLRSNKPQTLYNAESYCVALASNPNGTGIVSAHLDGSIFRYNFPDSNLPGPAYSKICTHTSVPYALSWGRSICAAGNDQCVTFYDREGGRERTFDYTGELPKGTPECKEFTVASFNNTGDSVAVGNFDCYYTFSYNAKADSWDENEVKVVENMYSVTAMSWKDNGSSLAVGTLCGLLDLYDACIRRYTYKKIFELTYVSPSQVLIRKKSEKHSNMIKSKFGQEITKVNIYNEPETRVDRYVVAHTDDSLILSDLETGKSSEIQWHGNGESEKYFFDTLNACLVSYAGELSIVEYGSDEVLASVRTEHTSSFLLSVRINERPPRQGEDNPDTPRVDEEEGANKKIAYLLDTQTVCVKNMHTQASTTINHDCKIDFLELNARGNLLLFRDKRRHLHLYDVDSQTRTALLNYCSYVQWVPGSDVVVAQNRNNMCVWYNIHAPDQVMVREIKGDIDGIERANGKTEVLVDETINVSSYELVEELIDFGTAIDDRDYVKAMQILEGMEFTPQSEAMWQQLQAMCIDNWNLRMAERCSAALGDVSRARYLHKVGKLASAAREQGVDVWDHWQVKSKMLELKKDLEIAEDVLIAHNKVDEAINMYEELLLFNEALEVAERRNHPDADSKRKKFYQYLLDSKQEESAAKMKETEGEYVQAINLYLQAGMPGKAARVIGDNNITQPSNLLESVAGALEDADMNEKAGDFYERMGQRQRALESFIKGHAFRKAVELARKHFPNQVVSLEESWGDHLVSVNQLDMAINHYMEAHAQSKAIDAALKARQWSKALSLADQLDVETARPYYAELAEHYALAKQYKEAEKCYVQCDEHNKAVEMWTSAGEWENAHRLAKSYLPESEITALYMENASKMEKAQKFKEAEKLYLAVDKPDHAIAMYKRHRKFDTMIALVSKYRKELLGESHKYLAQQLEMEGNLRDAEEHYASAGEWLAAVNMYRTNDNWEEAIRVAKFHGGISASKRVAYAYALHLGGSAGAKLLGKLGLLEPAIDYAMESGAFTHAFELARDSLPKKVPEVHLKFALYLEDEERFTEAEQEFIQASKPREAIDMYVHQQSWSDALRVAEQYDPSAVTDVYAAQGKAAAEREDWARAEEMFIAASKPDQALQMYENSGQWQDAVRVAQRHLPHKLNEVNLKLQSAQAGMGTGGSKADYLSKGRSLEKNRKFGNAIDAYLMAKKDVIRNVDDLEEIWEQAVRVARTNMKDRYMQVVREVSSRLVAVRKFESAAELMREADMLDEAVSIAISGQCWEKARELAGDNRMLSGRVESAFQGHMVKAENTSGLMEMGHTGAALDVLAQRGDWDRLWETAAKERVGQAVTTKYSAMRVQQLVDDGGTKFDEAVETLLAHGAPSSPTYFDMYSQLVTGVLGRDQVQEKKSDQEKIVSDLREVLYNVALKLRSNSTDSKVDKEFENLLMATHYTHMMNVTKKHGLTNLSVRCSIALLRYAGIIPTDKVFFVAGTACKEEGDLNLAFMLLNRYVDLIEAIEEGDMSGIDNSDFSEATNVPFDTPLPTYFYLPEHDSREEIRDWVLSICMDNNIEQKLPRQGESENTVYAGLYASNKPTCIVTGYPIPSRDQLNVNNSIASKKDWNALVSKTETCPWTNEQASPQWG
ncbi:hypothetical protein TrST_g9919 [Triparma strigata]|uniref:Intraflagellar transport protein 172 n=1 Tax=Triparma strigata TaxID=1606541 RepID=A0A9W7E242_9STRA|nr:hypothetical protein TrST_g9919 [Triparma strigata]